MYWKNLEHKTIGIWGMGREGQSTLKALTEHCLSARIRTIGEENTTDIFNCDVLIKSPGVSLYRPEIQEALRRGIILTSGTNLYFSNKPKQTRIIAVTGTKGKSTTSSLLTHTLKSLGVRVELGGNIGRPLLDFVDESPDWTVAELSSYQCADLQAKPDIGVLTNLYPEHLQWHGSHVRYYQDKWHMIAQSDIAVLNGSDPMTKKLSDGFSPLWFNTNDGIHIQDDLFYLGPKPLFPTQKLSLLGTHNAENACAVLTVIHYLGLSLKACQSAFQTFRPLPHRLQILGEHNGVTYVDDSISTTPETAIAALKALDHGQNITLIAGGLDRGQNYTELVSYMAQHKDTMRLVTLPDTGTRLASLSQSQGIETSLTSDMPTAVSIATHLTGKNGLVLLSPAAPSYNMYRNFEERGDDFKRWAFMDDTSK